MKSDNGVEHKNEEATPEEEQNNWLVPVVVFGLGIPLLFLLVSLWWDSSW